MESGDCYKSIFFAAFTLVAAISPSLIFRVMVRLKPPPKKPTICSRIKSCLPFSINCDGYGGILITLIAGICSVIALVRCKSLIYQGLENIKKVAMNKKSSKKNAAQPRNHARNVNASNWREYRQAARETAEGVSLAQTGEVKMAQKMTVQDRAAEYMRKIKIANGHLPRPATRSQQQYNC